MFIYKEGDKSKGPCEECKKLVSTTFKYSPLVYNGFEIPNILQDFCDVCGTAVSVPQQSSFKIRMFRQQYNHPIEFRIPTHHIDILLAIGMTHQVSQKPNTLFRILSELYLSKIKKPEGKNIQKKLVEVLKDNLFEGKSNNRISCRLPDTSYATLKAISKSEKIKLSIIAKGIIIRAKYDILDNLDKKLSKEFEEFAAERL